MLKFAIAGYRHEHVKELINLVSKCGQVTACCGISPMFAAPLAQTHPEIPQLDCDVQEMLSNVECDIVGLGDAYGRRGKAAIAALQAGKHVIADKPLCTSIDELAEIRRLAAEKHLCVGLMLPLCSNPNAVTAHRIIAEGGIGKIVNVVFTGQHPLNYGVRPDWYWTKELHGGTINDIAIHGIDLVEYVTGMKFKRGIFARCWNQDFSEVPNFQNGAQFMAELESGAGVMADVSYSACRYDLPTYWRFSFWGTEGWLEYTNGIPGVSMAKRDGTIKKLFPEAATTDFWQCFLDEINGGTPAYFNTRHILDVTEKTLEIQQLADSPAKQ